MRFFDWRAACKTSKVIGWWSVIILILAYSFKYWRWLNSLNNVRLENGAQFVDSTPEPVDLEKVENLFGTKKATDRRVRIVKESALPIKLMASFVAGGKRRSAAVLDSGAGKQRLYFEGDKIMPEVELMEIKGNSVLIRRSGTIERLSLPQASNIQAAHSVNSFKSEGVASMSIIEGGEELARKLEKLRSLAVERK